MSHFSYLYFFFLRMQLGKSTVGLWRTLFTNFIIFSSIDYPKGRVICKPSGNLIVFESYIPSVLYSIPLDSFIYNSAVTWKTIYVILSLI